LVREGIKHDEINISLEILSGKRSQTRRKFFMEQGNAAMVRIKKKRAFRSEKSTVWP